MLNIDAHIEYVVNIINLGPWTIGIFFVTFTYKETGAKLGEIL
jgi:hypothetical protein